MRPLEVAALRGVARACFADLDRAAPFAFQPGQGVQVLESSTELAPIPRDLARARLRVDGDPLVLCPGRLAQVKDPRTTLRAFARVRSERPGARLYLVYRDAPMLDACRAEVARLGIAGAVSFLGERPHDEMAAWHSAADFVMQSSVREVCGMAIVEAVACGATPVVTDLPSFRFVAGPLGAFAPVADDAAFARALLSIDPTPDRRSQLVARFRAHLSFDALAATLGHLYGEISPPSTRPTSSA
jgi:glycosyltransferase involved in cell wall biosynthesis